MSRDLPLVYILILNLPTTAAIMSTPTPSTLLASRLFAPACTELTV